MRRFFILIVLLCVAGFVIINGVKQKVKQDLAQPLASSAQPTQAVVPEKTIPIASGAQDKTSLFVPYWTLSGSSISDTPYDSYLYFGVTPSTSGLNQDESGYKAIDDFLTAVPDGKQKLLVLRMLESDNNFAMLKDKQKQQKLIGETLALAKEKGFDGVVLDLEISAIPFDSLIAQISSFNADFYTQTKKNNLSYGLTIYGDTFYRLRPFDVKTLARSTDTVFVMAYDFHKSRGNPGPNFPLGGKDSYGYDMTAMSEDFLRFVPPDKMTVVFGLFGYDWQVDAKGNAIATGDATTDREIAKQFLSDCTYTPCSVSRDATSQEMVIHYTDDNKKHIVWFEDQDSVKSKESYLRGKGINAFSFWANSYF
jgi:hypothetical protein